MIYTTLYKESRHASDRVYKKQNIMIIVKTLMFLIVKSSKNLSFRPEKTLGF